MSDFFSSITDAISGAQDIKSMSHYGSGFTPSSFRPVRAFHIAYDNDLGSSYILKDPQNGTEFYKAKSSTWSESLTFTSRIDGSEAGTVKKHSFSSKMDVVVRGKCIQLNPAKKPKDSFEYVPPAHPGAQRRWTDAGADNGLDMVCLTEKDQALARMCFDDSESGMDVYGKIELAADAAAGGALTKEMLITGLAVAQVRMSKIIRKVIGLAT